MLVQEKRTVNWYDQERNCTMTAFHHPSHDEMDELLRAARQIRGDALARLCARVWSRLTGRVPAPTTATYA
jgi:hypothetical protein